MTIEEPSSSSAAAPPAEARPTAGEISQETLDFARTAIIWRQQLGPKAPSIAPKPAASSRSPIDKARPIRPVVPPQPLRPAIASLQGCFRVLSLARRPIVGLSRVVLG